MKSPRIEKFLQGMNARTGIDMHYLLSGGGSIFLGQVVSALFALALATAMANLIPKETYGSYKYILSIVSILTIATLTGMPTSLTQAIARGELGAYRKSLSAKLSWGVLGSLGAIGVGGYYIFMGNTDIGYSLLIVALFLPLSEAYSLWSAVFAGKKQFIPSAIYNALVQAGATLILIITIFCSKNVIVIIFFYYASYTVFRYLAHRSVLKRFPALSQNTDTGDAVAYGKRLSLVGAFSQSATQLDSLLVWHLMGPIALATYGFAVATTAPMKALLKATTTLAMPKYAEKSTRQLRNAVHTKIWKAYVIFIPITIAYIALLPIPFHFLFPQYLDSLIYAQALGLTFLFFPTKLQSTAILTRKNRTPVYLTNLANSISLTIFDVIGIYFLGIWGAVGATLLQYVFSTALTYYYYRTMD